MVEYQEIIRAANDLIDDPNWSIIHCEDEDSIWWMARYEGGIDAAREILVTIERASLRQLIQVVNSTTVHQ